jgi:Bacterial lipid A biosynthesis acyltransferase
LSIKPRIPSTKRYLRACQALQTKAFAQKKPLEASRQFATVSANLYNLLPSIPVADHFLAATQISIAEKLAQIDQHHLNAIVPIVCSDGYKLDMSGGPAIFCSYHFGPYRVAVPFLVAQGVELTVVIDRNVVQQQGALFKDLMERFCRDQNIPVQNCQWRDTSEGALLLSLVRDIRRGRSVFFYIDANLGVNTVATTREKNAIPINFMGVGLFARAGVATLAYMTKSRIVPILMKRDLENSSPISAEISNPYEPNKLDRAEYVEEACSWMWKLLEAEMECEPFAWEPWRYVHRFIDIEGFERLEKERPLIDLESIDVRRLTFDEERFAVASLKDENYLFDRRLYRFYPITNKFRDALESLKIKNTTVENLSIKIIKKLVEMHVLVEYE